MKRLLILIILLTLTACTAAPTPAPSPTATATRTPSPTATLTPTAAGTASPTEEPGLEPWPTFLPRPTPAPRPPITFEQENGLPPGATARLGRGRFNSVELSPDGQYLVVGSTAGVTVYNAVTFEELWFTSTGDYVTRVAISPNGAMVAGAIRDETAVWDLHTGERLHVLNGIDGDVRTISWAPDSSRLFTGSYIGDPFPDYGIRDVVPFNTMLVWDIDSGELIYNLRSPNQDEMVEVPYEERLWLLESEWSPDAI